jgi:hypothetical protein
MNLNNRLWMLGVVGLVGCGVSNQSDAVNVAARSSCEVYERCGELGGGKDYANKEDCLTNQKAFWNNHWSVEACDDRINGDNFDFCLKALEATSCGNIVDDLLTRYDKCSRDKVCSGN